MKDSSEWIRQPAVDEAADAILSHRRCAIGEVLPNWIAKRLDGEPNGELYAKVYDWRRRREAEGNAHTIEVPPMVEAAFRAILDQLTAQGMASFLQAVRSVGGDIDRVWALRAADAERRRDQAEAQCVDVLALCRKAETSLAAAEERIGELERSLEEARLYQARLQGRAEQSEAAARAVRPSVTPMSDRPASAADIEMAGQLVMMFEPRADEA